MTQSVQTAAMPPSLAEMIPQDFQVLRELLEKTHPDQEDATLEMRPLHLLLKDFYSTYILAQLNLDIRSLAVSGAIKTTRSRCPDQQLLVKHLAQGIPDSFDPPHRAELPGHDEEAERFDQLLKLSDAAKDLDASLKELGTRRKEAQEIEAKREEIRHVQTNLTWHLRHLLNLTRHDRDVLDTTGNLQDPTDAYLDLIEEVRSAVLEVERIRNV